MLVSDLEPPEVFNNRKTGQNDPRDIEKNDCRKRFFSGCPNQGDAGDNGEDVEPPELLAEKQAWKDDGNLGGKPPRFYSIYSCPILLGTHSFYCKNNFFKKHFILLEQHQVFAQKSKSGTFLSCQQSTA